MTDSAQQRTNMVESQIRPSDITDRRILRAMADLPREQFVPEALASLAYMDEAVPLFDTAAPKAGPSRRMLPPRTLAKLVQLAQIDAGDSVLDVGAGRGYGAALLGQIAAKVVALESDSELATAATSALVAHTNVTVANSALATGAPQQGPYDVIVLEGCVDERPATLLSQLKPGGRLVGVINSKGVGQATVWHRLGDHFGETVAFEASVSPLPGFERTAVFVF